ncbi:MAG: GtrA family protein [Legionella sp.]|nr:GtrA family protein [Legionella sp.]
MKDLPFFSKQFFLFILVGLLNTIVGFGFYVSFIALGLHYTGAVLLATCFGALFNFFSTGRVVFPKQKGKFLIFALSYSVVYSLNVTMMKFYLLLGLNLFNAYLLSAPIVAIAGFLLMRMFVFKKNDNSISLI